MSPRFTIIANVFSGIPKSISRDPPESMMRVISISEAADFISSGNSISKLSIFGFSSGGSETPNQRAIGERLVPCTIRLTSVHRNTILNIVSLSGMPEALHSMAKIIGTAPRNPTHDTNTLSLKPYCLKNAKETNTLRGRVTNIITTLIIKPGTNTLFNSDGLTSSPSVRNIVSWHNHDIPSKKLRVDRLCTNFELPTISPAR